MHLVLLREIPEDDLSLRSQWNSLAERVQKPQVFYTYEWALAVQRAYHATLRPLVFLVSDEQGILRGLAALATDPGNNHASFLCATTADYCDFLSLPEDNVGFVAAVLEEVRKLGICDISLANLPADSTTAKAIAQAGNKNGYLCYRRRGYLCAQVSLPDLVRREGQGPHLPRKKMLRRFLNAMGREGAVRLDHAQSWEQVEPILPHFLRAHVARFLVTGRISNAVRAERREFLTTLAKLLCERGWLALTCMMSGGRVLAWNYGFRFQGTWFWYQPTFASELEKYSPGFCLLAKLIEEASDDPEWKLIDLGLGAEDYKDRFANQTRETLYVTLHRSVVKHGMEVVRYRAATSVKALPIAERAVRSAVRQLRRMRDLVAQRGLIHACSVWRKRLGSLLWQRNEVLFFEWNEREVLPSTEGSLQKLDLEHLAQSAMQYGDDPETLTYLLRAAQRMRSEAAEGYALLDGAGAPAHFAWFTGFEGFFLDELQERVEAPSPESVMLFDCWTPPDRRGHGNYAKAVDQIARRLKEQGKRAWIFSAATNAPSLRGLAKTGFQQRFAIVRHKVLWWQRLTRQPAVSHALLAAEVPARL